MMMDLLHNSEDRVERILALIRRIKALNEAIDQIRYDQQDLLTEVPEVVRTLGAARDAAIAELKTV
jgi:hypothetical protein